MPTVAYITHADCRLHETGSYHPERPQRLDAINDRLLADGLLDLMQHHEAPLATDAQLLRVHTPAHLEHLVSRIPQSGLFHLDPDTGIGPRSLDAARRAAGAVVLAVDLVAEGKAAAAFCPVRPPGHHAEPGRAMGFCLFNNIAVGAAHALARDDIERVAVLDFDVHHGNGTEAMFHHREDVLFCSTFQHPFYPYTDLNHRAPNVVHAPLPAGADGATFRAAVEDHWLNALTHFQPQMVLISAGFDGHRDDDLASLSMAEADYGWVTETILDVTRASAGGRIVSVLEGGYNLEALAHSAAVHVRALMT